MELYKKWFGTTSPCEESSPTSASAHSTSQINNLPYELLAPMFQSIPLPQRNRLRSVCKRWQYIMDNMVGMEIRIGSYSEFDEESEEAPAPVYHDPKVISEVGVESCLVGNMSDPMENYTSFLYGLLHRILSFIFQPQKVQSPTFRNPGLVSKIHFNGHVTPTHFNSLMTDLPYLTILTLHLAAFDGLEERCLSRLDFPYLEVLIIRGGTKVYNIQNRVLREWDTTVIFKNINTLIQNFFPRLQAAAIEYIYDMDQQLLIHQTILQFLQRHSSTIQRFNLQYCLLINEDFLHEDISADHPILRDMSNSLRQTLQLECFQIVPLCLQTLPYSNLWAPIIKEQKSLRIFSVVGVVYKSDFVQRIIDLNFNTLTNICVCRILLFENLTALQFDCGIFGPCENLRYLALRGWTVTLSVNSLINVDQLPKSLMQIDFGDMAIQTEDIRILSLEMPELQELELRFVGNKRNFGMDEATLREVIQRRQLKQCLLQRAFNGKLGPEGIANGDSDDPDYITESIIGFIGFRLTKKGFYKRLSINLKAF